MFLKAFAILDIKSGVYSQPFFVAHKAHAVRSAMDVGNDPSTTVGRYPFDFRLVCLGEFDDSVGLLVSTAHHDFGTIGSLLAQSDVQRLPKDPSEMTAGEVVELRMSESA